MDESPGNYAEFKKSQSPKDYIMYDSIYITFLKWQNFRNGGQISDYQMVESGKGREKGGAVIKGKRKDPCGVGNIEYLQQW